jgi:hypothetical protein
VTQYHKLTHAVQQRAWLCPDWGAISRRSAILLGGTAAIAPSINHPASAISLNEGFAATLPAGVANYYDRTNQYPNVVAIVLPSGGACTGTLIVSRTVLTAAQLVIGAPYTLEVLLDTSLSAGAPSRCFPEAP